MKALRSLGIVALATMVLAASLTLAADEKKKAKPYPLTTCVVSDEKLDAMGKPYVFTEGDREIKLCCKSCLKDFNKDKAKYLKKIADAEKKAKK